MDENEAKLVDLSGDSPRPETGPMEFDDDWRGIFIRGDDALMGYLPSLTIIKSRLGDKDSMLRHQLESLISLLESANHHGPDEGLQKMKPFSSCKIVSLPVVK